MPDNNVAATTLAPTQRPASVSDADSPGASLLELPTRGSSQASSAARPASRRTRDRQSDSVAKLGDLMLSKALDSLGLATVTHAGAIVGDLSYLSPEQTIGERIDARSDLYSLGATLYALLTGRPPCEGLTTAETVLRIQTQRPDPPTKYHLAIPALFEGIVLRLLSKRPDDRFTDATQLLKELDRAEKYTQTVVSRNAPPDAEPGVL
jgi:serine/threonine protein kinase